MSFTQQVQALVAGLNNPRDRFEIMRTLNYLKDVYASGGLSEDALRSDVLDICKTVISVTSPKLTEDEVRERAEIIAEEIVKSIKLECLFQRTFTRVKPRILF